MATIVINALSARRGGGQTYIRNLLACLDESHKYIVLVGPYNSRLFEKAAAGKFYIRLYDCGRLNVYPLWRLFWEYFTLPKLLRTWKADVYYAAGGGTFVRVPKGIASATIIRNMLPFDPKERSRFPFFSLARLKLALLKYIALYAVKRSDKVVFISEYSKKIVTESIPEAARKGQVIYHGIDSHFFTPQAADFDFSRFGVKRDEFYLYVSAFNHYKAQAELAREWGFLVKNEFPYPLLLTGFLEPGYTNYVRRTISNLGLEDKVIITGPVSYEKLPAYYAGARSLVFASSCECCPNILLEMMASGKPIFCSQFSPMPEIGGKNLIYFDPYQRGSLSEKILQAEKDFESLRNVGILNRKRAETFRWQESADQTVQFLIDQVR